MAVEATVLIPTHNHGQLLGYSVRSALDQSVSDIEVFIVGDGMDDPTRAVAVETAHLDQRVRVFDNPKGARHGESHRHAALEEASGKIVCYLADDDLWLPPHVETMITLLEDSDFAHALPVGIWPDGSVMSWVGHLEVESSRDRVIAFKNFIPLSCGAHTLGMYRRLPHGWRTTPEGTPTDVYMWSQILDVPGCRSRSGDRITVLCFPSPWREDMTMGQRLDELAGWTRRMQHSGLEAEIGAQTMGHLTQHRATLDARIRELEARVGALEGVVEAGRKAILTSETRLKEANDDLTLTRGELAKLNERRVELETVLEVVRDGEAQLRRQRDMMRRSLTWRLRDRLLRVPGVAPLARWLGRARSRRGGS